MTAPEATTRALAMHPDVIGVGRLCQELLASLTGLPITAPRPNVCPLRVRGGGWQRNDRWEASR